MTPTRCYICSCILVTLSPYTSCFFPSIDFLIICTGRAPGDPPSNTNTIHNIHNGVRTTNDNQKRIQNATNSSSCQLMPLGHVLNLLSRLRINKNITFETCCSSCDTKQKSDQDGEVVSISGKTEWKLRAEIITMPLCMIYCLQIKDASVCGFLRMSCRVSVLGAQLRVLGE